MTTAGTPDAHAVDQTMFREYDIRGFVDQNFTEPVLGRLGGALGTFLAGDGEPGTVAVGRDVRLSSQRYAATFIEGLRNTGARVIDVGQVPTPSSTTPSTPSTPMVAGASPLVTTRRSSTVSRRASVRPACPTASHCVRQISRTCSVLRREAPSAKPPLVPTITMMSWTTMCATSPHRSSWPAP